MALGSNMSGMMRLVLRQGLGIAALGIAAGVLLMAGSARFLSGWLYRTSPFDARRPGERVRGVHGRGGGLLASRATGDAGESADFPARIALSRQGRAATIKLPPPTNL